LKKIRRQEEQEREVMEDNAQDRLFTQSYQVHNDIRKEKSMPIEMPRRLHMNERDEE